MSAEPQFFPERILDGHSLACEQIAPGETLRNSRGEPIRHLLEADALFSPAGFLAGKGDALKLFRELQRNSALAVAVTPAVDGSLPRFPEALGAYQPYIWSRYSAETLPPVAPVCDAISVSTSVDHFPAEQLHYLRSSGSFQHCGVELRLLGTESSDAVNRLLACIDFISVRTDQLITAPQAWSEVLSAAARNKVAIICSPVDHQIFSLSSRELEHFLSSWLRGSAALQWEGRNLAPDVTEDRAIAHQIQLFHSLCEEFGENMLNAGLKFARLYQENALLSATTSVDQLHRLEKRSSTVPPAAFWQALSQHSMLGIPILPGAETRAAELHIPDLLQIHPNDNSAFAARHLGGGQEFSVGTKTVKTKEATPVGHLILLTPLQKDDAVVCYGRTIGIAASNLERGERISSEKLIALPVIGDPLAGVIGRTRAPLTAGSPVSLNQLDRNLEISVSTAEWRAPPTAWRPDPLPQQSEFLGYRRAPGRAGIRQYISIISQVGCTEAMTDSYLPAIREQLRNRYPHMDLVAVSHGFGCSHTENATRILPRLVNHLSENDNIGAVVWMGLGCQQLQQDGLVQLSGLNPPGYRKPERWIVAQNQPSEFRTLRNAVLDLAEQISHQKRELIPVSDLMSFVECGGSDGLSGVTANPLVGRVSRMLAAHGATIMIGETTELPAEHFLEWSASEQVARDCLSAKIKYNRYLSQFGGDERYNPVRGNKDGGISTALHKALGSAQKIAGIPIRECVSYGEKSSRNLAGVSFVDATSNDPRSVTARVIAGATLGFFTSGRMTPWGSSIAPTIKVATNTERAKLKADWVDFDAGRMISEGASLEDLAAELYSLTLRVANGGITQAERLGTTGVELWLPDTGFQ